jgi:hypothetical protein
MALKEQVYMALALEMLDPIRFPEHHGSQGRR